MRILGFHQGVAGLDPDDELDAGYTDAGGKFELKGDTRELTPIDVQLKIYHDCYDDKVSKGGLERQ